MLRFQRAADLSHSVKALISRFCKQVARQWFRESVSLFHPAVLRLESGTRKSCCRHLSGRLKANVLISPVLSITGRTASSMVQASYSAPQLPLSTVPAAQGSTAESANKDSHVTEVLTLRLAPRRKAKAVRWSEDVVDNEFMNKKKSKKCCIFHKQKAFGEWSDDDSDDDCKDCNPSINDAKSGESDSS